LKKKLKKKQQESGEVKPEQNNDSIIQKQSLDDMMDTTSAPIAPTGD